VVGGGDTAAEEATFLTHFASSVSMLVRRDVFRASKGRKARQISYIDHIKAMQERVFSNPKIKVLWNTVVDEALGEERLTGLQLTNTVTNVSEKVECSGLFYAIGK